MTEVSEADMFGRKNEFADVPSETKSKIVGFSIEEDGDSNKLIGINFNDRVFNFVIKDKKEDTMLAQRMPDSTVKDFGRRGHAKTGKMQIYKSDAGYLHGTLHGDKQALTLEFKKQEGGDNEWIITRKKGPESAMAEIASAIKEKSAEQKDDGTPLMHYLTLPVTGDTLTQAMPLGALIGATAMGVKHLGHKAYSWIMDEPEPKNSLIADLAMGGLVGGGASLLGKVILNPRPNEDSYVNNYKKDRYEPWHSTLHSDNGNDVASYLNEYNRK